MEFATQVPVLYTGTLPSDLMLAIAEAADRATLCRMTETSKALRALINSHEKSITVAKLSRFVLPPRGAILSSETEERQVIPAFTFETVTEFCQRDSRIESILNGGFLSTGEPSGLGLSTSALDSLKKGLRRAIYIADRLADVEADVLVGAAGRGQQRPSRIIQGVCDAARKDVGGPARGISAGGRVDVPGIYRIIRARQLDMICALSTEDLAFLNQLTSLAAMGYARYKAIELRSDPGAWDKVVAFREMLLRHGSLFLWAYVRGSGSLRRFMESVVRCGVSEIWDWEHHSVHTESRTGEAAGTLADDATTTLPGLHMAMVGELRTRLGCKVDAFSGDDVWTKSEELVCRVIGHRIKPALDENE